MWRGDAINTTEGRAVLHTALRVPGVSRDGPGGEDIAREVLAERERMLDVRRERARAASCAARAARVSPRSSTSASAARTSGRPWRCEALHPLTADAPRVRFVSNVDGTDLANALEGADAARTLFIVASKTFSTQETLANARSARALAGRRARRGRGARAFRGGLDQCAGDGRLRRQS